MADQVAPELIEDHEIRSLDQDQFGHAAIAERLHDLVLTIATPSNVALYGPWGSGKTGIGRLLASRFAIDGKAKFVRFDAFKYSENPLRRNFISAIARQLGGGDEYQAKLYRDTTTTDFRVPWIALGKLILYFAIIVAAVSAAVFGIALFFNLSSPDPREAAWAALLSWLPSLLIPSTVLTGLIAVVGKTILVENHAQKAQSDEEFETLFSKLVSETKADRVVIFVDELDRCSPSDVVATLDAIRTFLGVAKCVFIVAVDQQVLDEALLRSLKQATPADSVNPYYSAGSAYLDKVFPYQIFVPPLLPQSVTAFAVNLTSNRGGVWQTVDHVLITSILVPSHVRSPRRVKTLLNAYAVTYHVAADLVRTGQLDLDLPANADELARLVCLRIEFPVFASDLVLDPRLAEYVLFLHAARTGNMGFGPDEVEGEAVEQVPVEMLDEFRSQFPRASDEAMRISLDYALHDRDADSILAKGSNSDAVRRSQGQQLIAYLSRTAHVRGQTKALLHLQSSGNAYGLDTATADQIEEAAQNADTAQLRAAFSELSDADRRRALQFMQQVSRTALGIEAINVAKSIFALAADENLEIDPLLADLLLEAVVQVGSLDSSMASELTIGGAWRIACASSRPSGAEVRRLALDSPVMLDDANSALAVLRYAEVAVQMDASTCSKIVLAHLLGDGSDAFVEGLRSFEVPTALTLWNAIGSPIARSLATMTAELARFTERAAAAEATAQTTAAGVTPEVVDDAPPDPQSVLDRLGVLLDDAVARDESLAELLLGTLLRVNSTAARHTARPRLATLRTVATPDTVSEILRSAIRPSVDELPQWLDCVASVAGVPAAADHLMSLTDALTKAGWDSVGDVTATWTAAARSLARLVEQLSLSDRRAVGRRAARLGDPAIGLESVKTRTSSLAHAEQLCAIGLTTRSDLAREEIVGVAAAFRQDLTEQAVESELPDYCVRSIRQYLGASDDEDRRAIGSDLAADLITALGECSWMDEATVVCATVAVASRVDAELITGGFTLPSADSLITTLDTLSPTAAEACMADWLTATEEDVSQVVPLLKQYGIGGQTADLLEGVRTWRTTLDQASQVALVGTLVRAPNEPLPSSPFLEAIGLRDLPDAEMANFLVERLEASTTNVDRGTVFDLWEAAKVADDSAVDLLFRRVVLPCLEQGVGAMNIVFVKLPRVIAGRIPESVRPDFEAAVETAVTGDTSADRDSHRKRAERMMTQLGFPPPKSTLSKLAGVLATPFNRGARSTDQEDVTEPEQEAG